MEIILLSPLPPPFGGIATWTKSFIEYSKNHHHDVSVVNTALIGSRGKKENTRMSLIDELKRAGHILTRTVRMVKKKNADIVYITSSCSKNGLIRDAISIFLVRKRKIVFHCHCDVPYQIKNNPRSVRLLRYILKKSAAVLVLNKASEQYMEQLGSNHVFIVPNFIQDEFVSEKFTVSNKIDTMTFVGHVRKQKGVVEILEAAKTLPNITFKLVGTITDEVRGLDIPENVKMLGEKSAQDVREILSKSDVFLFPSYTEGFSIALLEAMACGLPVIASDVGANRDMLEGQGGIIVRVKNSEAIIHAIKEICEPQTRKKMSDWNLQKVRSNYTREKVLGLIFDILEGVAK